MAWFIFFYILKYAFLKSGAKVHFIQKKMVIVQDIYFLLQKHTNVKYAN